MEITTNLTQDQVWGVQFVIQGLNTTIEKQNESLKEDEEPKPLWSPQSYIQHVIGVATDSYYQQLLDHKKKSALQMFEGLSLEQQAALVAQLGIPDVIRGE